MSAVTVTAAFPGGPEEAAHEKVMRAINRNGDQNHELVLVDGMSPADVVLAHRAALQVLRPCIESACLDAYSDDAWPPAVLHSYERALSLARESVAAGIRPRRADPGMGIEIDVRDDAQFELLLDLAAHTINAEGWRGDQLVFGASDSGTSLWIAVTAEQLAELLSRLGALGIPSTAFTVQSRDR
ncbi:hypothetical protein ACIPLC_10755 [Kitasatospora sp. NPDC086801]|uniref:hypothetical protein n=1 Tax=Kitasatospora sp. NPDC086801 TaxID=3364066 RepID=UPI00381D78E1